MDGQNPKISNPKASKKRAAENAEATPTATKRRVTSQGQGKKVVPETAKENSGGKEDIHFLVSLSIVLRVDLTLQRKSGRCTSGKGSDDPTT